MVKRFSGKLVIYCELKLLSLDNIKIYQS